MTPALHVVTPLDVLRACLAAQDEVTLSGCAGTGKTWHVRHLIGDGVVLCAPTAKAALRLKQVCRVNTSTVHSIIYGQPRQRWYKSNNAECAGSEGRPPPCGGPECHCTSRLSFSRGADLEDVQLFVVDEASMVGRRLAADIRAALARLNPVPKILWVGDPAQLPPVGEPPGVDLARPDVMLDHVYRAQGGILALATEIRHAESFSELASIVHRIGAGAFPDVHAGGAGWSGFAAWRRAAPNRMAITHTNRDRVRTNTEVRRLLKRPAELSPRDRLIIRKNVRPAGVHNGEIYTVETVAEVGPFRVIRCKLDGIPDAPIIQFAVHPDFLSCATKDDFEREELRMRDTFSDLSGSSENPGPLAGLHLVNVQYGYAITAHACVHPDTLVESEMGLLPIRSVAASGMIATPDGAKPYRGLFVTSERPALKIATEDGYTVTVTPEHGMDRWFPDLGEYGRVEACDLQIGSWLRLRLGATIEPSLPSILPGEPWADTRAPRFRTPSVLDGELAEFLGMFVADGTLYEHGFRLLKRHRDVVDRFSELVQTIFGFEASVEQYPGDKYDEPVYRCEVSSTFIASWLRLVGGLSAHGKHVPDCVLRASSVEHGRFLRGMFIDGSVHVKDGMLDHIELRQAHPGLIPVLRTMLLRLGIVTGRVNGMRYDNLSIYGHFAALFAQRVGLATAFHRERVAAATVPRPTRYRVPVSTEQIARLNGKANTGNAKTRGYISRAVADGVESLRPLLDFHHVRIVSIEKTSCVTMCLEVPDGHRFLQNGFSGWNSQGSEAEEVGVAWTPGSHRGRFEDARSWLYTAVTRAQKSLTVWSGGL